MTDDFDTDDHNHQSDDNIGGDDDHSPALLTFLGTLNPTLFLSYMTMMGNEGDNHHFDPLYDHEYDPDGDHGHLNGDHAH